MEEKSHYEWQLEKKREVYEEFVMGKINADEFRLRLRLIDDTSTPPTN